MSFTLHYGNAYQEIYQRKHNFNKMGIIYDGSCLDYKQKIGSLAPTLCIQADVLYPNAMASVCHKGPMSDRLAVGCRGNQIDNEFPLESRVPVALPLVQYPSKTRGDALEEQDICAKPVLNWETHIKEMKSSLKFPLSIVYPVPQKKRRKLKKPVPNKARVARLAREAARELENENEMQSDDSEVDGSNPNVENLEEEYVEEDPEITKDETNVDPVDSENESNEDPEGSENEPNEDPVVSENESNEDSVGSENKATEDPSKSQNDVNSDSENEGIENNDVFEFSGDTEQDHAEANNYVPEVCVKQSKPTRCSSSETDEFESSDEEDRARRRMKEVSLEIAKRKAKAVKAKKPRTVNIRDLQKQLYAEEIDLEESEEGRKKRLKKQKNQPKLKKAKFKIPEPKPKPRNKLPLTCLRKYKNLPEYRIQGTWNSMFGGRSGACAVMEDTRNNVLDKVFVGCGSQLRVVSVKPSPASSMISYSVDSVWEEDKNNVPKHVRFNQSDPLNETIYQIIPHQNYQIVAVRRGKSIDLYDTDGVPSLLCSTPNICRNRFGYLGWNINKQHKDPLLLSMDINPNFGSEFITLDENFILTCTSFAYHTDVSSGFRAPCNNYGKFIDYPDLRINKAAGVTYANDAQTFYFWADSKVHFGDKRNNLGRGMCNKFYPLFDLRNSESSKSWSDQIFYPTRLKERGLNEFVSCVTRTGNPWYSYIGTTSRIFMMDIRVPSHPVLKMSHGMRSAATYIDSYYDGNFEVVVAGSQRVSETFCAIHDHAHVSCFDRPDCKARNPVLQSYPRHLSNSREFFDSVSKNGFEFGNSSDHCRAMDHNYAWSTGLGVCKTTRTGDPRKPPGVFVFSGNYFGDIFCQEWEQKPVEESRKVQFGDYKLRSFVGQWQASMKSDFTEYLTTSKNPRKPQDCTLLIEPNAKMIPKMRKVRKEPFNPYKTNPLYYEKVKKNTKSLKKQLERLKKYVGTVPKRMLKVWKDDWQENDICMEEPVMHDLQIEPQSPGSPLVEGIRDPLSKSGDESDNESDNEVLTEEQHQGLIQATEEIEQDMKQEAEDTDAFVHENRAYNPEDDLFGDDSDPEDPSEIVHVNVQEPGLEAFPGLTDFYPHRDQPSDLESILFSSQMCSRLELGTSENYGEAGQSSEMNQFEEFNSSQFSTQPVPFGSSSAAQMEDDSEQMTQFSESDFYNQTSSAEQSRTQSQPLYSVRRKPKSKSGF